MKKQRFRTKLSRKQKRKDLLVFLAVIVFAYAFTLLFSYGIGIFDDWNDPEIYAIGLALVFFVTSMTLVPAVIVGIVLGVQKGKARRIRDNTTFFPVQDLDYYRDCLSGLSPAIASLLIDLDIYGKKDVAATLLRMQNKGALRFNNRGGIIVVAENLQGLDNGELELLHIMKNVGLNNKKSLLQWSRNRFNDAEKLGYIRKTIVITELKGKPLLLGLLSIIVGFALWGWFLWSDFFYNTDSLIGVLAIIAILLIIDMLFFLPMYYIIQWSMYNKRFKRIIWERTELGNETAEKLFGLARFIREFSLLTEAKKEQVALWDDYLVYAIVLEENEKIVKDISKLYRINLRRLEKPRIRNVQTYSPPPGA